MRVLQKWPKVLSNELWRPRNCKKQCVQSISGHPVYVTKHAYINIYNENTIGLYGLQHFCRNLDSGSTKPIFQKHVRNFLSKVCLGPSLEERKYQFCHAAEKKYSESGNYLIWVNGSRRLMPIKIAGAFPKIVSILAPHVTPILFTNRFFLLLTDSRCVNPI